MSSRILLRVLVLFTAARFSLDPAYCACIVERESSWDPQAVGRAGEIGLTQILPSTGEWFASMDERVEWDAERLAEPAYNLTLFGIGQREGYAEHWSTHERCLQETTELAGKED